jgi:NhaP-type Na+/H+ and K+/H+ antiporter
MQFELILIFFTVWLLCLWLGAAALEASGLDRRKARFQALSALTGTGFTTGEAESIVNNPRRRFIASWLIFLGNAGAIGFIIALILWIRAGLTAPSPFQVIILIASLIIFALLIWLGTMDRITSRVVKAFHKGDTAPDSSLGQILHQTADYGVLRYEIGDKPPVRGYPLKELGITNTSIIILAVERGSKALPNPKQDEIIMPGDHLLLYGKIEEMVNLAQ